MKGWFIHARLAIVNLCAAKLRSFLAMLGILVGTASVVALMSLGMLATEKALEQFRTLGTDLISVSVYAPGGANSQSGPKSLSQAMWDKLPQQLPEINEFAPYSTLYQQISFQGKVFKGPVIGSDDRLAKIIGIDMLQGNFVSRVETFEQECVIGSRLAADIKKETLIDPIGQQLKLGNSLYTIIGITKPWQENTFFNENVNQAVIIPVASSIVVNKTATINNAIMRVAKITNIEDIVEKISQKIKQEAPGINVFVRSAQQIITSMEKQGQIFTLLLAIIGSISLLVGGVGVMNIMLVSVSERKKEIGIRKACGGTKKDIQALFLVESVILSLLGGIVGLIVGVFFTWLVAHFSHWTFYIFITPIIAGFGVSVAIGIFFGFYPAKRAASLEVVACLRNE